MSKLKSKKLLIVKGRKPKPDAVKKLTGTFRKDREKNPPSGSKILQAEPPEYFDDLQRSEFRYITEELISMEILERVDMNLVFAYCLEAAQYFKHMEFLNNNGASYESITETGMMVRQRPEVNMAATNLKNMLAITARLGMSPVDRLKLTVKDKKPLDDDPMKDFM